MGISPEKLEEYEIIDTNALQDTEIFYNIESLRAISEELYKSIEKSFQYIKESGIQIKEINSFRTGYGTKDEFDGIEEETFGHGPNQSIVDRANSLIDLSINRSLMYGTNNKRIGLDGISDIITFILHKKVLDDTQSLAKKLGVELYSFNIEFYDMETKDLKKEVFELPFVKNKKGKEKAIYFIPKFHVKSKKFFDLKVMFNIFFEALNMMKKDVFLDLYGEEKYSELLSISLGGKWQGEDRKKLYLFFCENPGIYEFILNLIPLMYEDRRITIAIRTLCGTVEELKNFLDHLKKVQNN